jgi:hypothetical protein
MVAFWVVGRKREAVAWLHCGGALAMNTNEMPDWIHFLENIFVRAKMVGQGLY